MELPGVIWKYSTVMQISVAVLGVKFLSVTTVTIYVQTISIAYSVKISSFDTSHGALPWPVMLAR